MRNIFVLTLILLSAITDAQAHDAENGYAIVQSDTIYGKIQINFEAGSILVKQDSINRMYLLNIQQVTLLNDQRDTYIPVYNEDRTTFYKILVQGDYPLLGTDDAYFTLVEGNAYQILEERDLYDVFGKRDVKDYIFLRNIQLEEERGIVDVFRYFNKHETF